MPRADAALVRVRNASPVDSREPNTTTLFGENFRLFALVRANFGHFEETRIRLIARRFLQLALRASIAADDRAKHHFSQVPRTSLVRAAAE